MKSDKKDLNLFEKKDTKTETFEKPYTFFLAIILGIVSVIISLSIGFFAYKFTLKITEERYHVFYMNKAKMLASIADSHKDATKDTLLNIIETSWIASGDKPPDEYICVVDKDANLILHTVYPDTIGKYVGDNVALDSHGKPSCRLREIVQSQVDYVGNYISGSGQSQIAAFAAIPQRQWILGVHRSKAALIKGIKANVFYFALGFIIVCGFFLPVSLVLLYGTFKASNRKRMNVEEELRLLNKSLEQRVTERTEELSKAIKEIKESEAKFQSILSSLYEAAIVIFDRDGKIMSLWGTPEMDERYGISAAEAVGSSFRDILYPEHMEQMLAHVRNVIDTGEKILAEHMITVPGGNFWHEISLSPMRNDKGDINAAVGFIRDITKRKQAEEELKRSRNSLAHAQQIAHLGSWEWDVAKNVTLCSDEHYRIHGLEPQQYQLTYEKFLELVHADDREYVMKSVTAALNEGKPFNIEFRIIRPDGSERIVHSEAEVKFDETGKPLRMIGTEHDITERKQAEKELRKQSSYCKLLGTAAISANEAVEIKDAFQPILEEICSYTGWEIGHAYVTSRDDPNLLEPTSVWWLEDSKHYEKFRSVSEKIKFAKGIGLPGRVLASAKPYWIVDVTKDKNFLRTEIASDMNIKSGIAFPVMVGTKVVAVLTFFTTKALEPDKQFMEIMAEVGTQLGRVVERKQAEEALREASELNERIISESPIGLSIYDQTGQCIEANTSIVEMINATREQVLAQNYNNIESWKKSGLLDAANKSIRLQEKERLEFDIETTFGKHGFYDCLFVPFMLRGEQHLLFMIDDITERKQVEEMLLKSDERYRSLINDVLDTSNVGVFILDKEFRVVWINKALESYFGLKRNEVIMKDKRQFIKDKVYRIFEDGEKFKERVLKTYDDNTYVENFVCHILPGDGREERWLEHWSQPIVSGLYAGGRVEHYTDITKRRLAEERIKGLAKFPGENPNPVLRVLNDGRILYNNQASMVLLDSWDCQTTKMLPDSYLKIVSDVLHSGLSKAVEVEFSNCVFSLTFAPVIEEGYVNVYGLDITERKQMEEALLQSEKMKAMGIMTSGVAHEFNNILAVISSNAQLLEETNRSDKELSKSLLTICRMADDGAAIVDRMYEFTDIHKDTSKYFSMDLTDLIKQVIDYTMPRWKEMAHANGITYDIDQGGIKTLPSVLVNPTEMREVFLNIINNSLDAMPDGGTITVMTRSVWGKKSGVWSKNEKDSKLDEDFVEISFEDTGKGMSDEVKNKVFDPFYTTRCPEGTGLGMSVSYGIITRHGGKIDIESKVGKGSKIIIKLPQIAKTINAEELPEPASVEKVGNLNVLVVDDEKDLCDSLSNFFKKDGHTVKCVNNGDKALKLLKNNDFDLLVCDLVMPEINGREVIKVLDTLNKRPKVCLITAENYRNVKDEDLNVDFVVKKPFKLSELRRDIIKIFSS